MGEGGVLVVLRWRRAEAMALRRASRMTQIEFASVLGMSRQVVSHWERGFSAIGDRGQKALDTVLDGASPEVVERFHRFREQFSR